MPGEILRRPQARLDLIDIWNYIADDNEAAADRMLDRIGGVLQMQSEQPKAGRERPELAPRLRSFPVGNYLLFYLPLPRGHRPGARAERLHGYRFGRLRDLTRLDVTPRLIRLTRGQVMRVKVEERCRGRAQWAIHRAGAHFRQISCRH
jgi:toxin ParE1/3/4